jgi:hypothetical protein
LGASLFITFSWSNEFERSKLHGENKGGEDAKGLQNDEVTLQLGMTRSSPTLARFLLE